MKSKQKAGMMFGSATTDRKKSNAQLNTENK